MNLSIKQKLIGSFLIVSLLFGISSFFSFKNMKETNESYEYLIETVSELRSITQAIQTDTALQAGYYRAFMLYEDSTYKTKFNETNEHIQILIGKGKKLATLQETHDQLNQLSETNKKYRDISNNIMDKLLIHKEAAIAQGLTEIVPLSTSLNEETKALYEFLDEILANRVAETVEDSNNALIQVTIISIIATLLAIALGTIISTLISNPLKRLGAVALQVASGDLNVEKIKIKSKDEVFKLNQAFEKMTENLRDMISGISSNSMQVAASAEQLNASADQSSKATETISTAIQEISSGTEVTTKKIESNSTSLQEVLLGVSRISESAALVSELSRQTTIEAEEGGRFVENNLKQMQFIHESVSQSNDVILLLSQRSKEIGEILSVINAIADQTNLLALNAAIEAARAGEHGKGFAVVADEVRKLAEQSQESTKNIAHLINIIQGDTEESVRIMSEVMQNAESGVRVSEQSSKKFEQILSGTRSMTPQIEEVTATVQQITASIQEVSSAADEISALSQTNSSSTEEVAASTEEQLASMEEINSSAQALASMAEELTTLVNRFKL